MVVEEAAAAPPLPLIRPLPRHVAVIMDGNGRWAHERGFSRQQGHRAGADTLRDVIRRFAEHGVPVLTIFAFSTENWGRPRTEVESLMRLGRDFLDDHLDELHESGVRVRHIGDPSRLPRALQRTVKQAVERTREHDRIVVNVAFNYGGRADIVQAVRDLVAGGLSPNDVTEEAIESRLATRGLPEPDLLIRTGGEHRISNFLVWQAAYAEYYFSDRLWPDFNAAEVDAALSEYSSRKRRFGLVGDGGESSDHTSDQGS
jgi:undecaprenyl diphosphate synthase